MSFTYHTVHPIKFEVYELVTMSIFTDLCCSCVCVCVCRHMYYTSYPVTNSQVCPTSTYFISFHFIIFLRFYFILLRFYFILLLNLECEQGVWEREPQAGSTWSVEPVVGLDPVTPRS